jgi:phage-related protein
MGNQELQIILSAKDKTDEAFKSVNDNLKKTEGQSSSFGKVAKIAFAAGATAVVAFGAIAKGMVGEYINDQKDMQLANSILAKSLDELSNKHLGALHTALGKPKDDFVALKKVMEDAGQAALKLGFDDEEASVGFSKLFQVTSDVTQAQKDLKLAMDLSAFSGKGLSESVAAVTKIHAGGTRILKDFGIEVAEGTTALDALNIANAKVGGTAEEMSKTLSVQLDIIKNRFANFKSEMGGSIIKALFGTADESAAMDMFKDKIGQVFDFLDAHKETISTVLVAPFRALYDVVKFLVDVFLTVKQTLIDLFTYLENLGFIQVFRDMWTQVSTAIQENLKPALNELMVALEPLMPFLEAIGKVIGVTILGAIILVAKAFTILSTVLVDILTVITKVATFLTNVFTAAINGVGDAILWLAEQFEKLYKWVEKVVNKMSQIGDGMGKVITGKISKVNDAVVSPSGNIISTHPDDYIIATKDPSSLGGGGTVVNIMGGNYLSEDAALEMGDQIIRALQLQMRGS